MTEDCMTVCRRIAETSATSVSLKKVAADHGWTTTRVAAALDEAEGIGVIKGMGALKLHFSVEREALERALAPTQAPDVAPAPEVAQAPEAAPATAPAQAPEVAPTAEEPAHAPKKSKLSFLLEKIRAVKAPEILQGDERDSRISEIFEACVDKVVEINQAITEIAEKFPMYVDGEKDLLSIVRVIPEAGSNAPGGVRVTYSPLDRSGKRRERILFEEPWPRNLTATGGMYVAGKVEKAAVSLLERMTNYVIRHAK